MTQGFGLITVPAGGTPVRATSLLSVGAAAVAKVQTLMVQALPTNTGLIYVVANPGFDVSPGDRRTDKAKVIATIGAPASATVTPPSATVSLPNGMAVCDLKDIWIDAGVNGEGAVVSGVHSESSPYV